MEKEIYKGDLKVVTQDQTSIISSMTHDFIYCNSVVFAFTNTKSFKSTSENERILIASYEDDIYAKEALMLLALAFHKKETVFYMPTQKELMKIEEDKKQAIKNTCKDIAVLETLYDPEERVCNGKTILKVQNGRIVEVYVKEYGKTCNDNPVYQFSAIENGKEIEKIDNRHAASLSIYGPFYMDLLKVIEEKSKL